MIGTCDCCEAKNVELSRADLAGLETWSCTDGCPTGGGFLVKFRLAPEDIARTDGAPFDVWADALDHRNWFFGHSDGVVSCWVENAKGLRVGAMLRRSNQAGG